VLKDEVKTNLDREFILASAIVCFLFSVFLAENSVMSH